MRDDSVSICKAFGIMLMVMIHSGIPGETVVSMFHMPLFFVMSGYCFKDKSLQLPSKDYFLKKVKTLWWPYVKWSMIFLLCHNLFFHLNILNEEYGYKESHSAFYSWTDIYSHAWHIMLMMSDHEYLIVGGYWFMKQIFFGSLIAYVVLKLFKTVRWRMCEIGVLIGMMMFSVIFKKKVPFFGLDALTFMSALLIIFGYYYHKRQILQSWNWTSLFAFLVLVGSYFWSGSMLSLDSFTAIPYLMTAFCGSIMIFNISTWINQQNWEYVNDTLVFIGNHTFEILTWHFLCFKLVNILRIAIYGYDIKMLAMYPTITPTETWCVLYAIVGIFIPILFVRLRIMITKQFI